MNIKVGISNHHIHITKEDFIKIYGKEELTIRNRLSHGQEFASNETATIKTNKGVIENVRILGPFRTYTQVELSKTDARKLGINPPIKDSGDLRGASSITIVGPKKEITKECAIIATRHIHITKKQKEDYGLNDIVKVKVNKEKPTILENVYLKISDDAHFELHLDTDDANACFLEQNDEVEIINE